MKKYSRLRAVIDLDAVMYNMEMMHANIEKGTKMVVVIKTDGYGHGAVPISRMLEDVDYVWGYAVATLDEGVVLRKAGIQKPILCLGCIFPDQLEEMIRHEIRMTTYSYELAKLADETAYRMGKKAYLHIKIDTGMSRLGFPVAKESVEEILKIGRLVYTDCEGMFTHFSKADETDKTTTLEQIRAFLWMKEHLAAEGMEFTYYHCANSASIIDMPKLGMNLERAGISTYGLDQFMVDVTGIPDVKFGDRATLVGHDGDAYLSIDELAGLSGRFNYEFICDINKRVPREYLRDGKVVEQVDYF